MPRLYQIPFLFILLTQSISLTGKYASYWRSASYFLSNAAWWTRAKDLRAAAVNWSIFFRYVFNLNLEPNLAHCALALEHFAQDLAFFFLGHQFSSLTFLFSNFQDWSYSSDLPCLINKKSSEAINYCSTIWQLLALWNRFFTIKLTIFKWNLGALSGVL